jgi:hypothetical protein
MRAPAGTGKGTAVARWHVFETADIPPLPPGAELLISAWRELVQARYVGGGDWGEPVICTATMTSHVVSIAAVNDSCIATPPQGHTDH